jgi:phage baseplate assembly protein W
MATSIYHKPSAGTPANTGAVRPQMYRGFSTVNTSTQNFTLYDFELIKQDIMNSFYVRQGERLMNPNYGTVIWDLLFEPMTPEVQNLIIRNVNQIFNADPRVTVTNLVVTPYDKGIQIACTLTYLIYNIQQNLQLQFDQANGLATTVQ